MDKTLHWNIGGHKGDKLQVMTTLNQGIVIANLMAALSQWEGKMVCKQFLTLAKVKATEIVVKMS